MEKFKDYYWLNKDSRTFLKRGYLKEGVEPEQRFREIAENAEKILKISGFADQFESYLKKGWYSLASPVLSNFGNDKGLPCSCNGSYLSDTIESIIGKAAEISIMTKYGAGTSAYFGEVRPRGSSISTGGKTSGAVHFMELYDNATNIISQSNVRRGTLAAYLPIDHGDILEFLKIKSEGHPIQNINFGVCISDDWMKSMLAGDKQKRSIWAKVIQKRFESGYPYIFFTDNVNNRAPQVYKDKNLKIHASNVCTEIANHSSETESFVCNLSSMNVLHWDQWKNTGAVQVLTYFLDANLQEYIDKSKEIKFLEAAHLFAKRQRSIGIGVLGWHSLLQSRMIPFESMAAKYLNIDIFEHIDKESKIASQKLAKEYGEPELLKGYGERNITRVAVAPTTSSSFIFGQVSQSIEPLNSNYFVKDLAKGKFTYKNPYLIDLINKHNKNTPDVWKDILAHGGSVQHLGFLSKEEKDVFKTFGEISQKEIIIQAVQRQKFIDQAQSINLMIDPKTSPKQVSELMIYAWEQGLKTLYYQRGVNAAQANARDILNCQSCES